MGEEGWHDKAEGLIECGDLGIELEVIKIVQIPNLGWDFGLDRVTVIIFKWSDVFIGVINEVLDVLKVIAIGGDKC